MNANTIQTVRPPLKLTKKVAIAYPRKGNANNTILFLVVLITFNTSVNFYRKIKS